MDIKKETRKLWYDDLMNKKLKSALIPRPVPESLLLMP